MLKFQTYTIYYTCIQRTYFNSNRLSKNKNKNSDLEIKYLCDILPIIILEYLYCDEKTIIQRTKYT